MRDAEAFLARPRDPVLPSLPDLRADRRRAAAGRRRAGSAGGLRARSRWAIGSPARTGAAASRPRPARALVDIARTLGLASLEGSHFLDNPASARVLEKLGFEPLGIVAPRMSCARGDEGSGAADAAALTAAAKRGAGGLVLPRSGRPDVKAASHACPGLPGKSYAARLTLRFGFGARRCARVVSGEQVPVVLVPRDGSRAGNS